VGSNEKLIIETPEQVQLEYQLAGIGSRFMALFVDTILQILVIVVVVILFMFLAPGMRSIWGEGNKWMLAGYYLGIFTLYWGYYALFELFWKGQTPGKRQAGIRVIHESGREISAYEAITRNLMRAVDSMPGIYGVGVIVMFMNDHNKRLGDYVAGTVVVHEKKQEEGMPLWHLDNQDAKSDYDVSRISAQEIAVMEVFLQRRFDYATPTRIQSANKLASYIRNKLNLPMDVSVHDENLIENIVREFRRSARFQ